jgi:hypothetical protein
MQSGKLNRRVSRSIIEPRSEPHERWNGTASACFHLSVNGAGISLSLKLIRELYVGPTVIGISRFPLGNSPLFADVF